MGRGVIRFLALAIIALIQVFSEPLSAQSPQKFSYQELIRDGGNVILLNQAIGMRVSILQGSAGGASVYTERQTPTTNANGLASIEVGTGTVLFGVFSTISWSAGPYFVKTEIDPAGGTAYSLTNTTQLLSVPYTLYAKTLNYNNLTNKPVIDGSETKIISGTTITVGGVGTTATPYVVTFVTHSVTQAQRIAIAAPYTGQFIWCNNCGPSGELQIYNGTSWLNMCGSVAAPVLPTVTTTAASAIVAFTATGGGDVTSDGGGAVSARGVCWSTSSNPTTADSKTTDGSGTGSFTSSLTGLNPATTYYVRAYATNAAGTSYGNEVSFITLPTVPALTTTAISAITSTTASSGGNITSDGGASVTARGVCWSTSTGPLASGSHTTDGTGSGIFTSSINGLAPGTLYYVRAYATNSAGTSYGNEVSFTTLALPTLTTTAISSITLTSASSGGNITSDGGASVSARGVCWSTASNPTTANSLTSDGTGTGSFTSSITGLSGGTTYYVRAYATNSVGTAYGNQQSFTTPSLPTVTTTAASAILVYTATSGGNVTSDGGSSVTARGVCWSIYTNPTTADPKTSNGTGTGVFTSSITGLAPLTTIYVRAYATNAAGTAYGNQISFTTPNLAVGDAYQGGIIAYILQAGDPGYVAGVTDGFIAPATDQSAGTTWGCFGTDIGGPGTAERTAIGGGLENTMEIISWCFDPNYAAQVCNDLVLNGYNDWYLPDNDELSKLYTNRVAIGGFVATSYWSSTEYYPLLPESYAYILNFSTSFPSAAMKNTSKRVRAIRSFLQLGDLWAGGVIYYFFKPGDPGYVPGETHGLVASVSDLSGGLQWYNGSNTTTGATGTAIGTGISNTNTIVTSQGAGSYAAKLCADYVLGTYSDFHLPSQEELNKMYINRSYLGGYTTTFYWSSTEGSSSQAYTQSFNTGVQSLANKSNTYRVRAVRAF